MFLLQRTKIHGTPYRYVPMRTEISIPPRTEFVIKSELYQNRVRVPKRTAFYVTMLAAPRPVDCRLVPQLFDCRLVPADVVL